LDKGDNDSARFWAHFVAALQMAQSDVGGAVLAALQSPQPPPIETILTFVINEITTIPDGFILVLDDYHLIEAQPIHDALTFWLNHLPPQMHLVIASRSDPPLSLSRLRGRGHLTELRTPDLRFTSDEAAAFLNQVMGLRLSAEDIGALEARTEGWIVGLQMAALSMGRRDAEHIASFITALTGSHRYILDYLTDEVLLQQPESVQTFLLETSILSRLTAPLCDAVTGQGNGQEMLERLEAANLFIVPLDDERRWYRYHHLFADFLRTELDKESEAALHLKAADWFAAHDLLPEAVNHALASGDMNEAARVIVLAAEGAFIASFVTFLGWLNVLPDELVRANGELATYKGFLLFLTRQYAEATTYVEAAERSLPPDAPPPSRGRLQSLKALIALSNDNLDSAIQLSREALDLLGDSDVFFRSQTLNIVGQILQMQGDTAAAADVYRDAVLVRRQAGSQLGAVIVLGNLVFVLNEVGRRREALALCQQAVEESASQPGGASPLAEVIYFVWSLLSYEANELDLAREQVLRGLDLCQQMHFTDGVFLSHYILAQVHLASGEIDGMLSVIQEVRQYAARLNLDLPYEPWLAALEAQASLQQGDLAAAIRWAEATKLSPADTPHPFHELMYFVYVRTLLAQNRPEDARTLLAAMERSAQEGGRHRKLITIYLQQALVQQALGHREQALARVESALRLAVPEGYRRAFLDEGPAIVDLLPQVRHIALDFVDQVLDAAGVEPLIPRAQALVEPLSERELQVLRLLATGLSSTEVAQELYIAVGTARTHIKNIYGKLGVHSRVKAITRAQELGLI
jgi:LuxR family maltose regulon positive regulatory protein